MINKIIGLFLLLIFILSYNINKDKFSNVKYENIIIVPYRNRPEQLEHFIKKTYNIINSNLPNTLFVIVEQEEGKLFNRGKIINIGFKEYSNNSDFIITHDIDIVPKKNALKNFYVEKNHNILGIYTSSHNTLGGIVKLKTSIFKKINGFPNTYWGWGVEDKALQNRIEYYQIDIKKEIISNNSNRFNYFTFLKSKNNDRKFGKDEEKRRVLDYKLFKTFSNSKINKLIKNDGLSTLKYKIINKKNIYPNLIHIITSV